MRLAQVFLGNFGFGVEKLLISFPYLRDRGVVTNSLRIDTETQ